MVCYIIKNTEISVTLYIQTNKREEAFDKKKGERVNEKKAYKREGRILTTLAIINTIIFTRLFSRLSIMYYRA